MRKKPMLSQHESSGVHRLANPRALSLCNGFTLLELIIVVSIIAILAGILLPVAMSVREGVRKGEASETISELILAFDLYRAEQSDDYPIVRADEAIDRDLIEWLEDHRMWSRGQRKMDSNGLLLDPWNEPYRYSLTRPTPATGVERFVTWNWNAQEGREQRWGIMPDKTDFESRTSGPLAYPYIWSLGNEGSANNATTWIFKEDGK